MGRPVVNILRGNTVVRDGSFVQREGNLEVDMGVDVASATTLTLGAGTIFDITGTNNITSMTAGKKGRIVILQFDAILTFTDGNNLKLAGNFTTTAGDTVMLYSDGTNWIELSRSVN